MVKNLKKMLYLYVCVCVSESLSAEYLKLTQYRKSSLYVYVLSGSVVSDSLRPHGPQPSRLLCPWDSLGKNTGVGFHALLHGIFLTQGSKLHLLHLLHWQADSLPRHHLGSPCKLIIDQFKKRKKYGTTKTHNRCIIYIKGTDTDVLF